MNSQRRKSRTDWAGNVGSGRTTGSRHSKWSLLLATLWLICGVGTAGAAIAPEEEDLIRRQMAEFESSLEYLSGDIPLPGVDATLHLASGFRYLGPEDTHRLLEQAWGNPPGFETEGAIVPGDFTAFGDRSWAVIISYEDDGYVSDAEAEELDYAAILAQMQAESEASNESRMEQGYDSIQLLGWAEEPRYDADTQKLYWAKEIKFGGTDVNTLNYNIRALSRRGVLVLNAVATMDELDVVRGGMQSLLSLVEFNEGSRYVDFDPDVDELAAYGIGALVAGKLAAKAGLLAKLAPLLLVFKKFGIVVVVGAAGLVRQIFGRAKPEAGSDGPPPIA